MLAFPSGEDSDLAPIGARDGPVDRKLEFLSLPEFG
jgi:hypothetical protein